MSERKNKGLLFKFLSFTNIAKMYNSIAIFIDGELVTEGTVGDVLMHLSKTDTIMVKTQSTINLIYLIMKLKAAMYILINL